MRKMILLSLALCTALGAAASLPKAKASTCDWYCQDGNLICPCDPRVCRQIVPLDASC